MFQGMCRHSQLRMECKRWKLFSHCPSNCQPVSRRGWVEIARRNWRCAARTSRSLRQIADYHENKGPKYCVLHSLRRPRRVLRVGQRSQPLDMDQKVNLLRPERIIYFISSHINVAILNDSRSSHGCSDYALVDVYLHLPWKLSHNTPHLIDFLAGVNYLKWIENIISWERMKDERWTHSRF